MIELDKLATVAARTAAAFYYGDVSKNADAAGHRAFALLLMGELVEEMGAAELAKDMSNEQFEAFAHACRLEHGDGISTDYIHAKAIEACAVRSLLAEGKQ